MMTDQAAMQAMFYQPCGAMGAFQTLATSPAERQRRIAPAIQKEQALLLVCQRILNRID